MYAIRHKHIHLPLFSLSTLSSPKLSYFYYNPLSLISAAYMCMDIGIYWSMKNLPVMYIKIENYRNDSPSSGKYQLPITLQLGMELCPNYLFHAEIWSGLHLHRSYACCQNLCEFKFTEACSIQKALFPCSCSLHLALTLILSSVLQ